MSLRYFCCLLSSALQVPSSFTHLAKTRPRKRVPFFFFPSRSHKAFNLSLTPHNEKETVLCHGDDSPLPFLKRLWHFVFSLPKGANIHSAQENSLNTMLRSTLRQPSHPPRASAVELNGGWGPRGLTEQEKDWNRTCLRHCLSPQVLCIY